MDTGKLRRKILDLAIHGYLVPQDPSDEPASALLGRIREEKARLAKAGRLKVPGKSSPTASRQCPFEVPRGWEWTTVGELLINRDGERIPLSSTVRNKQKHKQYDYYGAAGVIDKVDNYLFDERLLLVGEDGANLLSRSKPNAYFAEGKYWVNNHAHVLDATDKGLLDYVALTINSLKLDAYVTGSAQPKLSQDNLNKIPIPLPPLAEQRRIVAEVERWFALIDRLEGDKADLQTAVSRARSKVLDLAIHGKLVPQDPADEPASELLERIREEKHRLIKERKLKSPGKTSSAAKMQYPFEIPEGWEWTTLGELSRSILYGVSESAKKTGEYKLLRITDIQDNTVEWQSVPYTDYDTEKAKDYLLKGGDILFARTGGTVGKSYQVRDLNVAAIYASYLIRVRISEECVSEYVKLYFESEYYWSQIRQQSIGIGQPNVNGTILSRLEIPLPPLPEQRRIVRRIEEIFSVLDAISLSIDSSLRSE